VELLNLSSPHGTAWELFLVVVVIIVGPVLMERIRVPGMIGLLVGGCILGPNVLGIASDTTGILNDLGEVGLLYLLFVAGLELDLGVFAKYRNQAITFALLTFAIPLTFGFLGGLLVDYSIASSILLGSLWASYTLVVYPIIRDKGLGANRAVAVAVAASPIADTLALVVLAIVAGWASGSAGGAELIIQVSLGLVIVAAWCFLVLPRLAAWFFPSIGRPRTLRYVFMLGALLSAAVLSEMVGVEAIVGTFFAGLGLNRFAPNGGEFMERIEFFGSALLIPMFLVSVGTVIDPVVLVRPSTIALAAVFVAACAGGKLVAAVLCRPLFRFTWDEVGAMFGLSVAQAAATLAATAVGLEVGLFSTSTVNAVMFVIVVTLVMASISAERFGSRIPKPEIDTSRLGRSVVVHLDTAIDAPTIVRVTGRLAASDGGLVHPVLIVTDGDTPPSDELLAGIHAELQGSTIDADLRVVHDRSIRDGLIHQSRSHAASLLVMPLSTTFGPTWKAAITEIVSASPVPTILLRAGATRPERALLVLQGAQATQVSNASVLAVQIARRLRSKDMPLVVVVTAGLHPNLAVDLPDDAQVVEVDDALAWFRANGGPADEMILPGGRQGTLATGRLLRLAGSTGSTVLVATDPDSAAVGRRAADSLGLVTRAVTV
jgi:Kef-type K+ transport system membrane component KefB